MIKKNGWIGFLLVFVFLQLSLYAQESLSSYPVYNIPSVSDQGLVEDVTVELPSEGVLEGLLMKKLRKSSSSSELGIPKKESNSYLPACSGREKPVYGNFSSGGGGFKGATGRSGVSSSGHSQPAQCGSLSSPMLSSSGGSMLRSSDFDFCPNCGSEPLIRDENGDCSVCGYHIGIGTEVPIGDGLWVLFVISCFYFCYKKYRRKNV